MHASLFIINSYIYINPSRFTNKLGHVPSKDMQTLTPHPTHPQKGGVIGVQKVQKHAQNIKFSSKVARFAGKIWIDLIIIFYIDSFICATHIF